MTSSTIVLTKKLKAKNTKKSLVLLLSASERSKLRGRRQTICGQELLLQLPREGPLMDGDILAGESSSPQVLIKAAIENLIVVRAKSILELIKASYHLGNRHVDLELHTQELYLLEDPILAKMLEGRGLSVKKVKRTFFPELGAYSHFNSHKHI